MERSTEEDTSLTHNEIRSVVQVNSRNMNKKIVTLKEVILIRRETRENSLKLLEMLNNHFVNYLEGC